MMQQMFLGFGGAASIDASGGTKTTAGSYTIHTFTSSGSLVIASGGGDVDYLLVGGGGGGGKDNYTGGSGGHNGRGTGGGGAGLLRYVTGTTVTPGTYPVTVGPGGDGAPRSGGNGAFVGEDGTASAIGGGINVTAAGGGGGGGSGPGPNYAGLPGGSSTHGKPVLQSIN